MLSSKSEKIKEDRLVKFKKKEKEKWREAVRTFFKLGARVGGVAILSYLFREYLPADPKETPAIILAGGAGFAFLMGIIGKLGTKNVLRSIDKIQTVPPDVTDEYLDSDSKFGITLEDITGGPLTG